MGCVGGGWKYHGDSHCVAYLLELCQAPRFRLGAAIKQRYDLAPFLAVGAAAIEALAVHMVERPDIYGFVRWMYSQAPCFIFQRSVGSTRCSRAPGG